jgi:P27 family predicted phage terminase small subunit
MPGVVREDRIAADEWRRLEPQLKLLGLVDATNQQSFAAYCLSWSLFVKAKRAIAKEGFTYKTKSGQIKKHPAFEAMRAAGSEMRKFAIEHGITPASRGRANPISPQPGLPGVPPKPQQPTTEADDNERFFGPRSTALN